MRVFVCDKIKLTQHHYTDMHPQRQAHYTKRPWGGGVLNFQMCGPKGRKWGLKERVGTKNRGLTDFLEKIGLKELIFWKKK